ncbi:pseudouridine synthase [Pseudoalteromonas 'SMAR']|uniref:pseudouridine synthase n=1 Tax=Pseudoalteromonas 'SMAR' TaxID=3416908 RepID=UPI003AF31686
MSYPMRLAKYLSHCGVCSRKQASRLIDAGRVRVNGQHANHIDHVSPSDIILVDHKEVCEPPPRRLFAYYKPVGVDCKVKPDDRHSIYHHLPSDVRVYPIGRLDKDSHGLLLLSNDGALCQQLIHPDKHQEKEYVVVVDKPINEAFCEQMAAGVPVKGQLTQPCQVTQLTATSFAIVLQQGLNRQIRRMAHYCGHHVIDLKRIRIAGLKLEPLAIAPGEMRELPHDYFADITAKGQTPQ